MHAAYFVCLEAVITFMSESDIHNFNFIVSAICSEFNKKFAIILNEF